MDSIFSKPYHIGIKSSAIDQQLDKSNLRYSIFILKQILYTILNSVNIILAIIEFENIS